MYIDQSVYPDIEDPPRTLPTALAKADYVHRVCAAWDFHIHPEPQTFALFSEWKEIFDRYPVVTSPAYHAFRTWFGWQPVSMPVGFATPEPLYRVLDRLEGRDEDPCSRMI
ncbi:MAG: hypothetical protein ACRD7E_28795 [Bryobacteraceae bacterium]